MSVENGDFQEKIIMKGFDGRIAAIVVTVALGLGGVHLSGCSSGPGNGESGGDTGVSGSDDADAVTDSGSDTAGSGDSGRDGGLDTSGEDADTGAEDADPVGGDADSSSDGGSDAGDTTPSCGTDERLCGGACASCPDATGVDAFTCDGTDCVVDSCVDGFTACSTGCCGLDETVDGGARRAAGEVAAAAHGSGGVHFVFYDRTNRALKYAEKSGGSWTENAIDQGTVRVGGLEFDSNGQPHVAYRGGGKAAKYATKSGGSWTTTVIDGRGDASGIDITVDANDVPHVTYDGGPNGTLMYAERSGGSWSRSSVPADAQANHGGAIAVDSQGTVAILFDRSTGSPGSAPIAVAIDSGGSWTVEEIESSSTTADRAEVLVVDGSGNLHAGYEKRGTFGIEAHYGTNSGGSWTTERIGEDARVFDVELTSGGDPRVLWTKENSFSKDKLRVASRGSSGWSSVLVTEGGRLFSPTRFVRPPGGDLVLSSNVQTTAVYLDWRYDNLNLARRSSGTWSTSPVAHSTPIYVSRSPADVSASRPKLHLYLDSNQSPHAVYWDATNEQIRYAERTSGSWNRTSPGTQTSDPPEWMRGPMLDAQGRRLFVYGDASTVHVARETSSGWQHNQLESDLDGRAVSLNADSSGHPHLTYVASGSFEHTWYDGSSWQSKSISAVPARTTFLFSFGYSTTLDGQGNLHVLHEDQGLQYFSETGGQWSSESVSSDDTAWKDIALGPSGSRNLTYQRPVVASPTSSYEWYVGSRSSGGWSTSKLAAMGAGFSTQLDVGPQGNVIAVGYQYVTNDIQLASNATGSWQVRSLTPNVRAGPQVDVAVDGNGVAHVVFEDRARSRVVYRTAAP